jgi:hypothetical protein
MGNLVDSGRYPSHTMTLYTKSDRALNDPSMMINEPDGYQGVGCRAALVRYVPSNGQAEVPACVSAEVATNVTVKWDTCFSYTAQAGSCQRT